jgi:hypothetical protein
MTTTSAASPVDLFAFALAALGAAILFNNGSALDSTSSTTATPAPRQR